MTAATDAELIARTVTQEDRTAFGELVLRHQSAVRRFLRHLTHHDAALADDLAQETFITAWRALASYQGNAAFLTWLLGIAHNHARNARRSRRHTAGELSPEIADESTPAPAQTAAIRHDLTSALQQLNPDEQTALHLHYQLGLTHPEIAAVTAWPLGTVKTHLARGKQQLRQLLSAWNPQS